jgi:hypothetical protein
LDKAEGKRQKAKGRSEERADDANHQEEWARQNVPYFCLLPSAF